MKCIWNKKQGNKQKAVEEIKENRFGNGIEKNDEIRIRIQEPATMKEYWIDYLKKKQIF